MKKSLLLCALCLPCLAQVYTPPPTAGGNQAPQSNDTTINRAPQEKAAPLVGNEVPFIDPSAETVTFNGRNFAIADNRLFAARFERYLNEPEDDSAAAVEYRETIDEILALVSPHNPNGPQLYEAFKLLPKASQYPGDAKLCDSLSQAVYVAMVSKKNVEGAKRLMASLEDEKQRVIRDADWKAANEKDPSLNQTGETTGGGAGRQNQPGGQAQQGGGGQNGQQQGGPGTRSGAATDPGRGVQSLAYADMQRRILEIEAMKKKNELKGEVQIVQAKIQYQALMMQFFMQRRFQHVLMASRFYNQIYPELPEKIRKMALANSSYRAAILSYFDQRVQGKKLMLSSIKMHSRILIEKDIRVIAFLLCLPVSGYVVKKLNKLFSLVKLEDKLRRSIKG